MNRMALFAALAPALAGCFHGDHMDGASNGGCGAPYYAPPPAGTCGAAPPVTAQTAPPPLINAPAVASTPPIRSVPSMNAPPSSGIVQAGGFTTAEPPR